MCVRTVDSFKLLPTPTRCISCGEGVCVGEANMQMSTSTSRQESRLIICRRKVVQFPCLVISVITVTSALDKASKVKWAVLGNYTGIFIIIIIFGSAESFSRCIWDDFQTKATIPVSLSSEYLKAELNFAVSFVSFQALLDGIGLVPSQKRNNLSYHLNVVRGQF